MVMLIVHIHNRELYRRLSSVGSEVDEHGDESHSGFKVLVLGLDMQSRHRPPYPKGCQKQAGANVKAALQS